MKTNRQIPTKVVIVAAMPPPVHGQSVVTAAVARELTAISGDVEVIDISPRGLRRGLKYHLIRITGIIRAAIALMHLAHPGTKTIYTVYESGLGVIYNYVILTIARVLRFRIIIHHHTSAHAKEKRRSFEILSRLVGPRALHVVLSSAMEEDVRAKYPNVQNVLVANNACHVPDPRQVTPKTRRSNDLITVGFLSNLSRQKGLHVAIDALRLAHARRLKHRLIVAGPAHDTDAEQVIRDATIEFGDYIEFRGPVSGKDKDLFFEQIDFFIFPSIYRYEAQPLVLLEAMSYGIRCLATDRGYTSELAVPNGVEVVELQDFNVVWLDTLAELTRSTEVRSSASRMAYSALKEQSLNQLEALVKEATRP